MLARAEEALGYRWAFVEPLIDRARLAFARVNGLPPTGHLTAFIAADPAYVGVWDRDEIDPLDAESRALGIRLEPRVTFAPTRRMGEPWLGPAPSITTEADLLANLSLDDPTLFLLLAPGRARAATGPLANYRYLWRTKASGRPRLIEAPKQRLLLVQRHIARTILASLRLDNAAHGFVRGRSIVSHARLHVGTRLVLRFDLAEFFATITASRVIGLFRAAGYPERVAQLLALLTTTATPSKILNGDPGRLLEVRLRGLLRMRHLPQGAPTSPALANLCAFRLDRRLSGLAASFGATYSRYADDLVFSGQGGFERAMPRLAKSVAAIVDEEGFRLRAEKTRWKRPGARQVVTGLVVNTKVQVQRDEYKRFEAQLYNATRTGPDAQNRGQHPHFRDHLLGKIGFVAMVSPERGAKLRALFDQIIWP